MGYADGYYYGQGRIICDTSTFSVGDTIRVRSMTDSSKVWDQQVATVGTALVFTVPCYDYYKICTVQTINDTPTEIGGVYKTVDYGQTLYINVLDKTTLQGIQGILNAHQGSDLLSIGDEVNVTIGGVQEPYVLLRVTPTEAYFGWRYVSTDGYAMTPIKYSERSAVNNYCDGIYADMSAQDKAFIKEKTINYMSAGSTFQTTRKIWIPTTNEVYGNGGGLEDSPQFPYFTTQANRCKTSKGGTSRDWQLASSSSGSTYYVQPTGAESTATSHSRVLPCFMLTADS